MRVGIHAGSSSADEIVASCRDAGVDEIFLGAGSVPGTSDRGYMTPDDFQAFQGYASRARGAGIGNDCTAAFQRGGAWRK